MYKTGIGQDSHRFEKEKTSKDLVLGGVTISNHPALKGNSDADVVLHALTNAVSSVTGVNILGEIADKMCFEDGITNSCAYVKEALKHLNGMKITHAAFSIECKKPKISGKIKKMKESIASILSLPVSSIGITATSGENLTKVGEGKGIAVICVLTVFTS